MSDRVTLRLLVALAAFMAISFLAAVWAFSAPVLSPDPLQPPTASLPVPGCTYSNPDDCFQGYA